MDGDVIEELVKHVKKMTGKLSWMKDELHEHFISLIQVFGILCETKKDW